MVLIPELRSIDFSIPISSVSSILFLVEPKRTGHMYPCKKIMMQSQVIASSVHKEPTALFFNELENAGYQYPFLPHIGFKIFLLWDC